MNLLLWTLGILGGTALLFVLLLYVYNKVFMWVYPPDVASLEESARRLAEWLIKSTEQCPEGSPERNEKEQACIAMFHAQQILCGEERP